MANFKFLIVGFFLVCMGSVHAGYAQLAPPPTWAKTATESVVRIAANDASFPGGIRAGFASFNTGASLVQVPAAYRFASNAGRFAASFAFGWPAVFLAAGGLAYQYFTEQGFQVIDDLWKKPKSGGFFEYRMNGYGYTTPWLTSADSAKNNWLAWTVSQGYGTLTVNHIEGQKYYWDRVRVGSTVLETNDGTSDMFSREVVGSTEWVPVSRQEFETTMEPIPVPLGVPQVWPQPEPMWWPVMPKPIINPSPEPVPATNPLPVPVPQPMRIPQGEPQQLPNPNYDPVTNPEPYIWRQPVIDLVPSPTPDDPWRVDVQPKDITSPTYEPITEPEPVPDPANDPNATPSEKADLCADHPEILACAKPELDTPEGEPLDNIEKPISFMPETNWAGGSGFCPAPRHLAGANVDFKFDMVCDFMNGVRPVVLAIAAFVGGMILIGARGGAAE